MTPYTSNHSKHKGLPRINQPDPIPELSPPRWLASWRPYTAIILLGLLVFGRTIWFGYTYFDDDILILKTFHPISQLSDIRELFTHPYFSIYYRPIVSLSFLLDSHISNVGPWMYHCSNIVFHLLACCLTFFLLIKIYISRAIAFFATAILTVHPLTTQAVAWIPGRNDSLLAIFVLLAMIFLIHSVNRKGYTALLASLIAFLLGLWTKETALVIPVLSLSYLSLVARVPVLSTRMLRYAVGWVIVVVAWFFMRMLVFADFDTGGGASPWIAFVSNLRVLPELLGKLIVPIRMSVYPTFNEVSLLVGIAVIVVSGVFLLLHRELRSRINAFALIWIPLFLLPSLIVSISDAEHRFNYIECRAYLSVVGFAMLFAAILDRTVPGRAGGKWLLCVSVVVLFAAISINYAENYSDPVHHWESAVASSPNAANAYFKLGLVEEQIGRDTALAEQNYKRAILLDPENSGYHNNLGIDYGSRGSADLAEKEFQRAIELNPADPYPHNNLGFLHYLRNDYITAESRFKEAVALDSTFVEPQKRLVMLYYRENRYAEALIYADRLQRLRVAVDPDLLKSLHDSQK